MATEPNKLSETEGFSADDPQPCSTSTLTEGSTSAFLARKGVLNARGQLMLKSLTYAELEQWCISVGVLQPSSSDLMTAIPWIESSAVARAVSGSVVPGVVLSEVDALALAASLNHASCNNA